MATASNSLYLLWPVFDIISSAITYPVSIIPILTPEFSPEFSALGNIPVCHHHISMFPILGTDSYIVFPSPPEGPMPHFLPATIDVITRNTAPTFPHLTPQFLNYSLPIHPILLKPLSTTVLHFTLTPNLSQYIC